MQPYFMPYIGYWQLLAAVDEFVVYDNIKYTKKGWINRNRILCEDADAMLTIPLKKDSDSLEIAERTVAEHYDPGKLLRKIEACYRKAPFFPAVYPLLSVILGSSERGLFGFVLQSISLTAKHLGIRTPIVVSSRVEINHSLRGEEKVLAICNSRGATTYVNAIGGQKLYSKVSFGRERIALKFIRTKPLDYPQFSWKFVANLSIIDVMMFNSPESIRRLLGEYELV